MINKKWSRISVVIASMAIFVGCNKQVDVEVPKEDKIILEEGAFVSEKGEAYEVYNVLENQLIQLIPTNKVITNFNTKSKNYIFFKDGKYHANYNGTDLVIEDRLIKHPKISPDGTNIFYFTESDILQPFIFNLDKNSKFEITNKAVISGEYIEWISDEKLVFYGVDTEKRVGGLFTYDIVLGEEEMVYEIKNGYIDFMKATKNGVLFVQENINSNKILKKINIGNEVIQITNEIVEISDAVEVDDRIFLLGRMKDNISSIYEIIDGKAHRVLYDYPSILIMEKGLSVDKDGNLLFIGSSSGIKEESIYKYNDSSVSILTNDIGLYNFIDIN